MDGSDEATLFVAITDDAVEVLTSLDPFEYGIDRVAVDWVERWYRGNYYTESIERSTWPTTTTLELDVDPAAVKHLRQIGRALRRAPGSVASAIINERAGSLLRRKRQGMLAPSRIRPYE